MRKIIIVILYFFLITSCDCLQIAEGIVIDLNSNKPIDSVVIINPEKNHQNYYINYTNENGEFSVSYVSGGIYKCPPMPLIFKKPGYDSIYVEIDHFDTVKMKPCNVKPLKGN